LGDAVVNDAVMPQSLVAEIADSVEIHFLWIAVLALVVRLV
jgi:hypothetical protein